MSRPSNLASIITILLIGFLVHASAWAQSDEAVPTQDVLMTWQLLDYIGVDYPGAVEEGQVVDQMEYAEQQEFAQTVTARIGALPVHAAQSELLAQAARLQQVIDQKADAAEVAGLAHGLADKLLAAYPVPLAPKTVPDLVQGARDYAQHCAACHGAAGDGQGPLAASLDIPPIDFTETARARQRSVFALYQVITQGLDGTPMAGYPQLSDEQRWALALVSGGFAYTPEQVAEGQRRWQSDDQLRGQIADLQALAGLTPAALQAQLGEAQGAAVMAFLRSHPQVLLQARANSLTVVRERLAASVEAVQAGDRKQATTLALSAYLDGFEPYEPALRARDAVLVAEIEAAMLHYRAALQKNADAEQLQKQRVALDELLGRAEALLADEGGDAVSVFIGAATILLREGLEALLIVIAMIAFLRKAERTQVIGYVHGGWVSALVAGFLTWVAATWMINISGASRELMEGFGSLLAAVVLLSVGVWMHGKAQAGQWQRYIREKMSKALSGRSAWLLFGLAFIVVYREVFETILFYAALSAQGNQGALLGGALTASVVLAVVAWLMLRYSRTLPISEFFRYSAWLMAILTVVLAGKGMAALQEAGWVGVTPLAWMPRADFFGVTPTLETTATQVLMAALVIIGFVWNQRAATRIGDGTGQSGR
ncbi:c-type cytochrome [Sinimarinibacterium sp. NLF-5-8]|nr:c-type cytochrome [Sinimarinibacterium sp. NLF-5-8]